MLNFKTTAASFLIPGYCTEISKPKLLGFQHQASDHFYYYIISLREFALKSISNSVVHWYYQERFKASVHLLIINTVLIKPISQGNQKFFRAGKVSWNKGKSINLSPTKHEKKNPKGNVLEFFSHTVF